MTIDNKKKRQSLQFPSSNQLYVTISFYFDWKRNRCEPMCEILLQLDNGMQIKFSKSDSTPNLTTLKGRIFLKFKQDQDCGTNSETKIELSNLVYNCRSSRITYTLKIYLVELRNPLLLRVGKKFNCFSFKLNIFDN